MAPKPKSTTKANKTVKRSKPAALPPPRKWAKAHPRFLTPELHRRGLPANGSPSSLIARLKATDAPRLRTPELRLAAYKRAVNRLQTSSLKNLTPFPQFNKLPLEIRDRIWEFSLPGPRVVALDTLRHARTNDRLCISRIFKAKNPAALFTCNESRAVALRRYRLAFGTANVYFDFAGGDILYFGPDCYEGRFLDQEWDWQQYHYDDRHLIDNQHTPARLITVGLCEGVRRDLESVRHLAISRGLWENHREGYAWFGYKHAVGDNCNGDLLRKRLRKFKSLERVYLEHGRTRITHPEGHQVFCGSAMIEDPWFEKKSFDWRTINMGRGPLNVKMYKEHVPRLEEWLEMPGRWEVTGDLSAVALLSRWDTKDLSKEEQEKGVPEVRLVDIKFVADEPKRIREENWRHYQWAMWGEN